MPLMNDRYAPPRSEVSDPKRTRPPSPPSVRLACLLILAGLALSLVSLLPFIRPPAPDEQDVPLWVTLLVVAIFGSLTVWFTVQTSRGKNWARWAILLYLAFGWVLSAMEFQTELERAPLFVMINSVCIALELVACWKLFTGEGAGWFAELANGPQA
jgi:hypothetical protein